MSKFRSIYLLALSTALVGTLTGCLATLPEVIRFEVSNEESEGTDILRECLGGLKGRLEIGNTILESPNMIEATHTERWARQNRASAGDPVAVEGWCYDESGKEIGFARVERQFHAAHDNGISIFPAFREESDNKDFCLSTVEARGEAPCISGAVLE